MVQRKGKKREYKVKRNGRKNRKDEVKRNRRRKREDEEKKRKVVFSIFFLHPVNILLKLR